MLMNPHDGETQDPNTIIMQSSDIAASHGVKPADSIVTKPVLYSHKVSGID